MRAILLQIEIGLRLHFRNPMAVTYSYLFPTIFLVAFWTLYRYEQVPLVRHMGELLTITVLGGACFGLPTTLVSDRERGVWRRYRLAPVRLAAVVGATLATRYVLLLIAALLQLALAWSIGMPLPGHPIELAVAFTAVAFALMGLGLTIAALADNVPAVQALGQCIFLPMLILGGVAVPLTSLPPWAERLSAFFPGRYAVDAISATVIGGGLRDAGLSFGALVVIGAAATVAGARMFRWDRGQRFRTLPGKSWILVALASWAFVGLAAQPNQDRPAVRPAERASAPPPGPAAPAGSHGDSLRHAQPIAPAETVGPTADAAASSPSDATVPVPPAPRAGARGAPEPPAGQPGMDRSTPPPFVDASPAEAAAEGSADVAAASVPQPSTPAAPWRAITIAQIEADIDFTHLPPDRGIVTPIAPADEIPGDDVVARLETIQAQLPGWPPGQVADPVQRVRNMLTILGVPDVQQEPIERYLPAVVFAHVRTTMPEPELVQVLYWIAMHPYAGDDLARETLGLLGFERTDGNPEDVRNRTAIYGVKLLGRLLGHL